ncbi:CPBP family intramembrane glutamic endopeptidase [Actinomyces capricornis]|uniref:CAAX amino protease n=1 Tax=Actinomyces capricornis TaxID=2755559 RepID=A0ABM7U7Y0_9ACTO|nr:CPBP family intramembrane glutamic endopeptidase [Actinomyces capricornis]BDA63528.1 CAAX amino protease [Actinomyces capricornis]
MLSRFSLPLYILIVLSSGWVGLAVNRLAGLPDSMESPATLIWILTPLLAGAVLALSDRARRRAYLASWRIGRPSAYAVALAVFPAATAVALGLGWALGVFGLTGLGAYGPAVAAAVAPTLMKNIGEEGAWRGYLAPALIARGLPEASVWLLSGAVWGLWHLPYYLFFLDEALIRAVWDAPPIVYALVAIPLCIAWAPLLTELRLAGRSVWPCVLAHSCANLIQVPLSLGWLPMSTPEALLFSPIVGIVHNGIVLGAGLALRRRRRMSRPSR